MSERVQFDDAGELDEVVTHGGAHLERMTERSWFLVCAREDGSGFAVWIEGRVTSWEERPIPQVPQVT